ncbi:FAD-dependent oxidoreductase [uncultured Microscilla sp.]|uniref:FAD-dependent oxidoreductase n=1 Tax=uncultured Microscilla sp. TaxID=432653 RepID=UPI00261495BE|nr:FAD-dependent oxidoreductase [uncultured Microscilla sp.]
MTEPSQLIILGGGPAGLAVGFYAQKQSLNFTLYEASHQTGGNCITLSHRGFRFDSGAHRFHAKDPEITQDLLQLMGERMPQIHAPSQIYSQQKLIDFPLTPLNLVRNLGLRELVKASWQFIKSKLQALPKTAGVSFEELAVQTYGKTIAQRFLLNYSEKLWGLPPAQLSPEVAGKRLSGLNLRTFIKEALQGNKAKTEHIDGSFYYPVSGIGEIFERMEIACGKKHVHKNSPITRIYHHNGHITAIEVNHQEKITIHSGAQVVSTLPLSIFLQILEPKVPAEILALTQAIRFQHLMLVGVFLNKPLVTSNASLYFPDNDFIFTRVVEPRNRSIAMAPAGNTSLIAEIPYNESSPLWQWSKEDFIAKTCSGLVETGLVTPDEIIDTTTYVIKYAYPVLALDYPEKIAKISAYLQQFSNLHLSGRGGKFVYGHIHDMMRYGKDIVLHIS